MTAECPRFFPPPCLIFGGQYRLSLFPRFTTVDGTSLHLEGLHLIAFEHNARWRLTILHRRDESRSSVFPILSIGKPSSDFRVDPIGSADATSPPRTKQGKHLPVCNGRAG